MLTDPKKLRTPGGFGFLVSWRDRFRDLDEAKAGELAERLLDDPANLRSLKEALGQPDATREEIAQWLTGALAAGSMVALRTRRKPPTLDAPTETDLRDLVDPTPGEDEIRPEVTTWLELRVVDELGEPIAGVPIRIRAGDETVVDTNASGIARLEDATTSFGTARIGSASALHDVLRERWSVDRDAPWLEVEGKPHLTVSGPAEPLPEVGLQGKTPHTLVLQPRVGRVRIVGTVFDTNKAFVLPDALGLLRDVADLYDDHPGATMLVVGHTDTSGEPDLNLALSLDRARAVSAYLTDDVEAWLAFYGDDVSASQRWGHSEDALLLERALWGQGQVPTGDPVAAYQEARGLTSDGDLGPNTRRALIEDYMSLDGSTLPASITPVVHGCGESFPLSDDGETLDVDPPDGVDDPTDRRVEVLFFDPPMGILPEPPSDTSAPGDLPYGVWCRRAVYTRDMLVVRPLALAVRVTDEETGEALQGAEIEFTDGGLSGKTDRFGVRTFLNVVAGSHHIRAAKPGYGAGAVEHVVLATAAATVVPLALEPERAVRLVLGVRGPDGAQIPLPEGVKVSLAHEGGETAEATTGEGGEVSLEASQSTGTTTFSISFGEMACLTQAPDGTTGLAPLDDALVAAAEGTRFIQLPGALELPDPRVVFDDRVPADTGEYDASSLIRASRDRPLSVELAPTWEHVTFAFFDRHHGRLRTVPGPVGEGQPALVMTGHVGGSEDAQFHTAWSVDRDGRTMHALAWFLEQGGVPTEADAIRMQCPERTYVVSSRESPGELALQVFPSAEAAVDAPNPDRLLYYDLPAQWHCDRYFARRATDDPGSQQPYVNVARQTALASPIVVSLDDIVMMRSDGSGGRTPVPIEGNFTILDNELEVYKPNDTDPEGYGEPYFTHQKLLRPAPGTREIPPWLVLDAAGFTRAIVYRQIYDVFDARTTVEDVGVPVGARVAYTPFAGDEREQIDPVKEHVSPFCYVEGLYQIPRPSRTAAGSAKNSEGLGMAALFRATGSSESAEHAAILHLLCLAFDFASPQTPPEGAKSAPTLSDVRKRRVVAQALHVAGSRWSGRGVRKPQHEVLHPVTGESAPSPVVPFPFEPLFRTEGLTCGYAALFVPHDPATPTETASATINLWSDIHRSSMSHDGPSDWDLHALRADKPRSTVAHELGHALGLPDEYVETERNASLGFAGVSDLERPPGVPYRYDVELGQIDGAVGPGENLVGNSAIMVRNMGPRPRHYASLMLSLMRNSGMQTSEGSWHVGEQTLAPLAAAHTVPGLVPNLVIKADNSKDIPLDGFLYLSESSSFADLRFRSKRASVSGILVMRVNIAVSYPETTTFDEQKMFVDELSTVLERVAKRVSCFADLRLGGQAYRVAAVLSPGLVSTTLPRPGVTAESKSRVNDYLRLLVPGPLGPGKIFPILDAEEVEEQKREISERIENNLAGIRRLEERNSALRGQPPSGRRDMEIGLNQNIIGSKERENEELRADLSGLSDPEKGTEFLAEKTYLDFVNGLTRAFPPHIHVLAGSAQPFRFTSTSEIPTVRVDALLAHSKARRLVQKQLLACLGLPFSFTRPTTNELQDFLTRILAEHSFVVDHVTIRED